MYFRQKVVRTGKILNIFFDLAIYKIRGNQTELADALFFRLADLGGLYIKFLQVMVLKPQFNNMIDSQRYSVFDDVEYEPIDVQKIIASPKYNSLVLEYSDPIAAGSFAQVYLANLNGQKVVIKILRPSVQKFLHFDQRMIKIISYFLKSIPKLKGMGVGQIVDQFIATTTLEVDYINETKRAVELYEKHLNNSVIVVPKTYKNLCSKTIIVQQYLDGVAFTELLKNKPDYCSSKAFEDIMVEVGYQNLLGSLNGERVHADPHAGNLILMSGGRQVGLIDFGIAAEPPKNTSAFYELVKCYNQVYKDNFDFTAFFDAIFKFYAQDLYSTLSTLDTINGSNNIYQVQEQAHKVFEDHKQDPEVMYYLKDARIRELFSNVINSNNIFGLDIVFDGGTMQVGASTFIRLLEAFDIKSKVMSRVYNQAVEHVTSSGLKNFETPRSIDMEFMAESLHNWFDKIVESNPVLFSKVMTMSKGV